MRLFTRISTEKRIGIGGPQGKKAREEGDEKRASAIDFSPRPSLVFPSFSSGFSMLIPSYLCLGHGRGHLKGINGGEKEAAHRQEQEEGKREARHHRVSLSTVRIDENL